MYTFILNGPTGRCPCTYPSYLDVSLRGLKITETVTNKVNCPDMWKNFHFHSFISFRAVLRILQLLLNEFVGGFNALKFG